MKSLIQLSHINKTYDDHQVLLDFNLDIYDGEFLTLLGPSGCGKTTLLRMLAGFEMPDQGQIHLKEQLINDIPPEDRHVNLIFQNYALFPHMSVFQNIAFGLQCEGINKTEINERVEAVLQRVKLTTLQHRKPANLSGGQQQRVAIARALVKQPLVLLLDEPFSALDYHLRRELRLELKALQRQLGITFVFVTHDQEEALSLSDRIVVMNEGRIEQVGTPRRVYEEPENLFVANFIGSANILDGVIKHADDERMTIEVADKEFSLKNSKNFTSGQTIHVIIRPEDIQVWGKNEIDDDDSAAMVAGTVTETIYKGSTVDLKVELITGELIYATEFFDEDDENLEYDRGEKVWVSWQQGWEVILPYGN